MIKPYISLPIIFLLILISAFSSCVEMAYSTVNLTRLKKEAETNKDAKVAVKLYDRFDSTVSTLLLLNNIVNVGISTLMLTLTEWMNIDPIYTSIISILFSIIILLFFGEIIPKQLGKIYNFKICLFSARIVTTFKYILYPFTFLLVLLGHSLDKKKENKRVVFYKIDTGDELQEMVDVIEEEGVIEKDKAEYVRSAIKFNDTEAYEIMKHISTAKMWDINKPVKEMLKDKDYFIYSRIPIYDKEKSNIVGILPLKIVERLILNNKDVNIKELMYPPLFVPHSMKINDILLAFKKEKHHICIVIDEFGRVEGILTMEDILEELVGEIYDETDEVSLPYKKVNRGYIVEGSMNIDDLYELFEIENPDEERSYTTVSGWCTEKLNKFPEVGDKIHDINFVCTILEVDKYVVKKVRFIKRPHAIKEE